MADTTTPKLRGHHHPMSRYQQHRRHVDDLVARQAELTGIIAAANLELAGIPAQLEAARAGLAHEQAKVDAEVGNKKRDEFLQIAAALDVAETAENLAKFKFLAADLHSNFGGLVRPAHEARVMTLKRLAGQVPGAPPLRAKSYLATARSWLRAENAA
jgi:hypothetical protein